MALKISQRFKKVFMRSSQSYMERVAHHNTMTILKEIGGDTKYSILGGKLVHKDTRKVVADNGAMGDAQEARNTAGMQAGPGGARGPDTPQ
jgi:hypothetical protein